MGDIEILKKRYKKATTLLIGCRTRNLSYDERLRAIGLPTLKHRRIRGRVGLRYVGALGPEKNGGSHPCPKVNVFHYITLYR
jgi:hypothetical protein